MPQKRKLYTKAFKAKVVDNLMMAKKPQDCPPAVAAAIVTGLTLERNIHNVVLMPYPDQLGKLPKWFVQLWAESLGKDGKGATPVAAQGPVDQHSQFSFILMVNLIC